jgi:hypothetical protein
MKNGFFGYKEGSVETLWIARYEQLFSHNHNTTDRGGHYTYLLAPKELVSPQYRTGRV